MDKIVLIPLLISAALLTTRKLPDVFIWVFLPCLTMIPTYFDSKLVQGIPELYFWSAALIPIIVVWAAKSLEDYEYHWMDLVIFLYIAVLFLGHLSNNSYAHAQKYGFRNVMAMFFPYIIVRTITQDRATLVRLIRMMTLLCAVVAIFNILEFRIVNNFFDTYLRRIWPHYVMYDYGMMLRRWGFKRALGPFTHPIIAGNIFAMMTPLSIWCHRYGHYHFKKLGLLIIGLNVMGMAVAISRAPIVGTLLGFLIVYYGWSKKKEVMLSIGAVVMSVVILMALPKFIEYASISPDKARSSEQRNVALRWTMWKSYAEIVSEKPWLGWGINKIPHVKGLIDSIDAEYLRVALTSGVVALGLYLTFFIGTFVRVLKFVNRSGYDDPWARLGWCILAGWLSTIFSLFTVYAGAQSVHYLAMLGGVVHVLVSSASNEALHPERSAVMAVPKYGRFGFQRVV